MKRACVLFVLATGFAAALLATSVLAAPGDLYVGDFNSGANAGTIFKFTPDGTKSIFAIHVGGLIHSAEPAGLAFDGFGNLFEAEPDSYFGGTIFKFTPTGDESSFGVEISSPGSLAFDIEGNLFVSDPGFIFAIIKIRPDGTQTTFVGLATARDALAFDAQGDLFGVGAGAISKFAPDGTESIFASGLNPTGLAFDSQGNLFVSDVGDRSPGSGSILKFTPAGSKSIFASGLSDPRGLAFDSMGNLFEADFNSGTIFKFSPDGKKSIFASGLDGPVSLAFQPIVVQLGNLSTRGHVQTGNNVLIGGFVIGGTVPKPVLIRAVGPSLANFGVADSLQNPTISLFHGNSQIAGNDDWQSAPNSGQIPVSLQPTDPHESAILITLQPGAYTAIVTGNGATTGVALVEIYDLNSSISSQLINISTRGLVQTGDNVMIGGFFTDENGGIINLLIRAIGPSLTQFGVAGALADPTLELFNSQGIAIASNDNWKDSQQFQIEATGKAPTNDLESAIFATLPSGAYTAIISDKNGGSGVGLVEAFIQ